MYIPQHGCISPLHYCGDGCISMLRVALISSMNNCCAVAGRLLLSMATMNWLLIAMVTIGSIGCIGCMAGWLPSSMAFGR